MTDLHTHILWSADDGADDEEMTRQMLIRCQEQQILTVAATPHGECCRTELYEQRFSEAAALAEKYGITLLSGAEYLYGDLLAASTEQLRPIAGKNYLLLDLRNVYPDHAVCCNLYKLTSRGFRILLAHPERVWNSQEILPLIRRLTENYAVSCQLNAGSILGIYGAGPRRCAWQLLEAGFCAVIASDAHHPDQLLLPECRTKLRQVYPEKLVELWMDVNPERVAAGEPIAFGDPDPSFPAKLRRIWKYWI